MKRSTIHLLCCLLAAMQCAASRSAAAAVNLGEILFLGDSITYGGGGVNAGYRGPLHTMLTTAGCTFQFVGDSTLNPGSLPVSQQGHSGHSSYATWDVANNLDGVDDARYRMFGGEDRDPHGGYWITGEHGTGRAALSPKYVLLLVGANDLYFNEDGNAQVHLHALIAKLITLAPPSHVLVANMTPSTHYGDARIDAWNAAVDSTVAGFQSLGNQNVVRVDMNTAFPSNGLSGDGVHPNDVGYAWMAEQWSDSLMAIAVPEPGATGMMTTAWLAVALWRRSPRLLQDVSTLLDQ